MTETPTERDMRADERVGRGPEEGGGAVTAVGHRPSGSGAGDAGLPPVVRAALRLGESFECRLAAALTGVSDATVVGLIRALQAGRSPRWALPVALDELEVRQRLAALALRDPRVDAAGRRRERARALAEAAETLGAQAAAAGVGR